MPEPTCRQCGLTPAQRAQLNICRKREIEDLLHLYVLPLDPDERAALRSLAVLEFVAANSDRVHWSTTELGRRNMSHICQFTVEHNPSPLRAPARPVAVA